MTQGKRCLDSFSSHFLYLWDKRQREGLLRQITSSSFLLSCSLFWNETMDLMCRTDDVCAAQQQQQRTATRASEAIGERSVKQRAHTECWLKTKGKSNLPLEQRKRKGVAKKCTSVNVTCHTDSCCKRRKNFYPNSKQPVQDTFVLILHVFGGESKGFRPLKGWHSLFRFSFSRNERRTGWEKH